eukprot:55318-Chlamydomonas_euryale.AAC.2
MPTLHTAKPSTPKTPPHRKPPPPSTHLVQPRAYQRCAMPNLHPPHCTPFHTATPSTLQTLRHPHTWYSTMYTSAVAMHLSAGAFELGGFLAFVSHSCGGSGRAGGCVRDGRGACRCGMVQISAYVSGV